MVLPQVARTQVAQVLQSNKDTIKGLGEDRRHLGLKKEGLLSEKDWIHQQPQLTAKDLEQRQALYIAKDAALKKSPNLSVSPLRLQLRNLPKKDFFEPELRALMVTVMEHYRAAHPEVALSAKKLITQTKILRDAEKTVQVDTSNTELKGDKLGTAFKAASGLAFVELANHEAALYTVHYLNNMQLTSRGLVVDFCLQDARKMFRRTQKLEKHQRLAMEKKAAEKKQRRDARRDSDKQPKRAAAPVTDVALLKQMKAESQSRGKKQRLNKQIATLTGETALPSEIKASKDLKQEAKTKVQTLLRKRDEKLKDKTASKKPVYTAEDKTLIAQQKNAKREKRRESAKTEQDFDELYKTYEKKLLKRLAAPQSGPAFEQIDFSD